MSASVQVRLGTAWLTVSECGAVGPGDGRDGASGVGRAIVRIHGHTRVYCRIMNQQSRMLNFEAVANLMYNKRATRQETREKPVHTVRARTRSAHGLCWVLVTGVTQRATNKQAAGFNASMDAA